MSLKADFPTEDGVTGSKETKLTELSSTLQKSTFSQQLFGKISNQSPHKEGHILILSIFGIYDLFKRMIKIIMDVGQCIYTDNMVFYFVSIAVVTGNTRDTGKTKIYQKKLSGSF